MPPPRTASEYQRRLDRLLCLRCGRPARPQPNGQAYCPRCRRLYSFVRRRRDWSLVRAFAAGVTATAAAVVAGVTAGTAAKQFRRFRRALIDATAADSAAAYRRLKLKPASSGDRFATRKPRVFGVLGVNGRMAFVRPAAPAETLAERLRSTGTPGVVLTAPPAGGFAVLRVAPSDLRAVSRPPAIRRVLRFWESARRAVLRHRAVRWAEVDGYLAEQACRQRMTTDGLLAVLYRGLVRHRSRPISGL